MAKLTDLQPGDQISFELNTPLIQSGYKDVTYEGKVGYSIAAEKDDVDAIHYNIIGTLPVGTPKTPSGYPYILVRSSSGKIMPVGVPWIRDNITIITRKRMTVVINNTPADGVSIVTKALHSRGITDFTITES